MRRLLVKNGLIHERHDDVITVEEFMMKKLFVLLIVSLMGLSTVAIAGNCGSADHEHDVKKKSEKGA